VGLLVLTGAYFVFFRGGRAQTAPAPSAGGPAGASRAVPVVTAPVRTGDLDVYLTALGSVTALNTVTVRSRVDGQILQVLFNEGQVVHAGDLLAQVDPRPFQAQLTQAEGQLARDRALLENARVDLVRYRTLVAQEAVPRQQLDTQAALVKQYEGTVKVDQGMIDGIRLQLAYCRITAPLSGRVGLRLVDPGNIVHATDINGIVVITQVQPIAVVYTVAEDSLPPILRRFRTASPVPVDAYDREMRTRLATGTLVAIDNQIDPTTGTVKLKASFQNADGALFPNQFVNARTLVDVLRAAVLVPAEAIQRGPQGAFAYVIRPDGTAESRATDVGPSEGGIVAVRKGLAAGETVVVDGADKLQDGTRVEPRARDQTPPAARPGA
jgi:multidrug efflux system membrane fusion protein